MRSISFVRSTGRSCAAVLALAVASVFSGAACAPPLPDPEGEEVASRHREPLAECPVVTLPPSVAAGMGTPEERTLATRGEVLSLLDERGPSFLNTKENVRLDASTQTVTRDGWTLHAHAGERFSFEFRFYAAIGIEKLPLRLYGPLVDCAATEAPRPDADGVWIAPADGDYFVTGVPKMWREKGVVDPASGGIAVHWMLSPRRLDALGAPVAHHLEPTNGWGPGLMTEVADAVLRDLDHDGDLDILANVRAGSQPKQYHGLLRIDQTAPGTFEPRPITRSAFDEVGSTPGRMIVADFDGDGIDDVFSTVSRHLRELYVGQPDGGYVSHMSPVDLKHLFTKDVGAADVDGDGDLDVVTFSQGFSEKHQILHLRVVTNQGDGTFVAGPYAKREIAGAEQTFETRAGFHDVDGDGKLDAVVEEFGHHDRIQAFSLPDFAPLETPVELLETLDIDRQFERRVDIDGDGRLDVVSVRAVDWTRLAVGVEFGRADGTRTAPWLTYPPGGHTSKSGMIDVGDVDGDGCLDALVGVSGLFLSLGRNCVHADATPAPGSCVGACGDAAPDGACWCDDSCLGLGDCCADKLSTCP